MIASLVPTTKEELNGAILALAFFYFIAVHISYWINGAHRRLRGEAVGIAFNASTFAFSVLVLVGVRNTQVLTLIGDSTAALITGGLAGIVYSVYALVPKKRERD